MHRVSTADIERVVRRDFPPADVGEVFRLLSVYGRERNEAAPHFMRLAILRLATGQKDELESWLERAHRQSHVVIATLHERYGAGWLEPFLYHGGA
ncbi:MAG: hypothetical protein ACREMX_10530 [Gemmatimonadales bacterium]